MLSERVVSNDAIKRSLWETDALLAAASRLEQLVVLDGELSAEKLSSLAHLVSNTSTSDRVVQLYNGSGVLLETHSVRLVWEVDSIEPLEQSAQLPASALSELLAHSHTLRLSSTLAGLMLAESEHSEGAGAEPEWAALLLARLYSELPARFHATGALFRLSRLCLSRLFAHLAEFHADNDAVCEPNADTSNLTFRVPLVCVPLSATQLANQYATLLAAFVAANESQLDRINEENVELPTELSAGDAAIDESVLAPVVFFVAVWAVASLLLPKATAKTRVNRFLVETLLEKDFASYSLICNLLKSMKETDESVCGIFNCTVRACFLYFWIQKI